MEKFEYLPLGSIVVMKGGIRKIMILARGLAVAVDDTTQIFDYGGCLYPEGLMGDQILQFNPADIVKIVHKGFVDEDEELMLAKLDDWMSNSSFERADPLAINMQRQQDSAADH
ncbi:MAG: DUF4176 domain-containing protein [Clostridiales Family XIII bacterium]|nr:DUF4176 domain-containing protein [Clostridiales Family XIII bacterium]